MLATQKGQPNSNDQQNYPQWGLVCQGSFMLGWQILQLSWDMDLCYTRHGCAGN